MGANNRRTELKDHCPYFAREERAVGAIQHGRKYIGCEINPEYQPLQQSRLDALAMLLFNAA